VCLEKKPFAKGGGGLVFKGTYQNNAIAAKTVYGQALSEATAGSEDPSTFKQSSAEFDREVRAHTCA
jgi:hypothetical protein